MLTPAQPVSSSIFLAACGVVTSPLPMTGMFLTGLNDGANALEIHGAGEALFARAAMNENRGDADIFQRAREIGRGEIFIVPTEPHLGGDGNFHGIDHALDERRGLVQLRHHGRAAADAADLAHRATHVDIDGRNADGFEDNSGIAHFFGNGAEQLHGERTVRRAGFDEFESLWIFLEQRAGVDEVGRGESKSADFAQTSAETAGWCNLPVGDRGK